MNKQKTLSISILGKSYSIVTDEEDAIVVEAASMVDQLMQKVATPSSSPIELMKKTTFVALQVAVDLVKQRREFMVVSQKTDTLNDLLKEVLPG